MIFLFLDIYYADAIESTNFFKDYIIPILTGITIPFVIFLFTIWNEEYKKLLDRYHLTESLYYKNLEIIESVKDCKSKIAKNLADLTFDNNIISAYQLNFKSIKDINQIAFDKFIETFHDKLSGNETFKNEFTIYNNTLTLLLEIPPDYNLYILENNKENLLVHNELHHLSRELILFTRRKYFEYCDPKSGNGHFYWMKINEIVQTIMKVKMNESILEEYYKLKEYLEKKLDPDYFSEDFYNLISLIIDKLEIIKGNVNDMKENFKDILKVLENSINPIQSIQPNILIDRPNKLHFWKYFSNK
ncbi:hypothetical protein [Sphingobacterium mizutaii]|uniref:hypothetical protein n=1 Tax=Sphingobacterium mizutaii TaxID=1010 RepID=UPI003D97A1C3